MNKNVRLYQLGKKSNKIEAKMFPLNLAKRSLSDDNDDAWQR